MSSHKKLFVSFIKSNVLTGFHFLKLLFHFHFVFTNVFTLIMCIAYLVNSSNLELINIISQSQVGLNSRHILRAPVTEIKNPKILHAEIKQYSPQHYDTTQHNITYHMYV